MEQLNYNAPQTLKIAKCLQPSAKLPRWMANIGIKTTTFPGHKEVKAIHDQIVHELAQTLQLFVV